MKGRYRRIDSLLETLWFQRYGNRSKGQCLSLYEERFRIAYTMNNH